MVPERALRGFAIAPEAGKPEVYVYEKNSTQHRTSKIKEIAFENHFYTRTDDEGNQDTNTIEDFFADEVESPAKARTT